MSSVLYTAAVRLSGGVEVPVFSTARRQRENDATLAQVALAWSLAQGEDVVRIPGTKQISRLEENSAAATLGLPSSDIDRIDRVAPRDAWTGDRVAFTRRQLVRR
jgi:aryl-alcohol dehydrogenase-like predicted oxidoreductase